MKRSGGQSLVRQGAAYWVIENVLLRMLPVRAISKNITIISSLKFIPSRMPAYKTPGTNAVGPVVEQQRSRQFLIIAANKIGQFQARSMEHSR